MCSVDYRLAPSLRQSRIPPAAKSKRLWRGTPAALVEILSPDHSQTKVTSNILHCWNHGSSLGWLIDPEERSVLIFPPKQQPELLQNEADRLIVPEFFPQLKLTVGDLFNWLKV